MRSKVSANTKVKWHTSLITNKLSMKTRSTTPGSLGHVWCVKHYYLNWCALKEIPSMSLPDRQNKTYSICYDLCKSLKFCCHKQRFRYSIGCHNIIIWTGARAKKYPLWALQTYSLCYDLCKSLKCKIDFKFCCQKQSFRYSIRWFTKLP